MQRNHGAIVHAAIAVFVITVIVWAVGISKHRFLISEFWLYVIIFIAPAGLLCVSLWLILMQRTWLRVVGALLALPGLVIWLVSLLLVYGGFRIH